jgi:aminoglycoside phosphotransferase (APT) family kinase protein
VIEAIVEQVWPGGVDLVEPLGGGITNHNFKVSVRGESFVLRVGGRDTALLGIDRRREHEASLAATALGIGPEVVAFVEPDGYLVTRFVEGEVGRVAPREAAFLLARFHGGAPIGGRFDSFRVVEAYAATAREAGVPLPPGHAGATAIAERIERRRGPVTPVPCHNDLLAANFIHARDRVWLVDWEYAGMGDPAFDLANYAANNGLDEAGDRELLGAYGGGDLSLHVLMRYMSDFREAMWGVVQQAVSELDFDFAAYAAMHFERLERARTEPRFASALA